MPYPITQYVGRNQICRRNLSPSEKIRPRLSKSFNSKLRKTPSEAARVMPILDDVNGPNILRSGPFRQDPFNEPLF